MFSIYGLCKANIVEVTVLDASAHTVPTYNATPLTVKSSIKCVYDIQANTDFHYSIILLTWMSNKQKKYFIKMTSIIFLMHKNYVSNMEMY